MEKHELIDIVGRGSKVRKSINSHLIIGENTPEYDRGDILDANATTARITSKVEEAKTYLKNYVDNNHKPVAAALNDLNVKISIIFDQLDALRNRIKTLEDNA